MRHVPIYALLLAASSPTLFAVSVGSGSPTMLIRQSFVGAYDRGQFSVVANATPLSDVRALGTPGLVQEFSLKTNDTVKLALVKPDPAAPPSQFDTLQVYSDIYSFYLSVGAGTAGYPVNDTTACPANSFGVCNFQLFTKNYALFAYSAPFLVNYAVRDPFYTPWNSAGGISGVYGPVTGAETTVVSYSKAQGIQQTFVTGTLFSYPAGASLPTVHGVPEPVNSAFNGAGGYAALGFPISEFLTDPTTGIQRQSFENGRIEVSSTGVPTVLFAIRQVDITYANLGLTMALNSTAIINATELDTHGYQATGRVLSWSSSNGAAVTVAGNGESATLTAVGAGSTNIYATAEGKTSAPLLVIVKGTCCSVGDGAPPSIAQAFQTALTRNGVAGALSVTAAASRTGNGYTQAVTNTAGAVYVIAEADNAQAAYLLSGAIYAVYLVNGGFTGPLGYPVSDLLPGNMQRFAGGGLIAGAMPRLIPALLAAKWLQTSPGDPIGDASAFTSVAGKTGIMQAFAKGTLFALNAGAVYLSSGAILTRYLELGGPAGALGVPTSDIFAGAFSIAQNFETGYIDLQAGAISAVEHFNPRHPALTVSPSTVTPGGRVHIAATGFAPGASLNFTIAGQQGFSVQTAAGVFEWDVLIPVTAKSSTVVVQAKAASGSDAAGASYAIASARELLATLTLLSGDQQTAFPASSLSAPIVALVQDAAGNPLQGVAVSWSASPGAVLQGAAVTDAAGRVALRVRLPSRVGVVAGSISAAGRVVNFSALASAGSIASAKSFTADAINLYLTSHHGFYTSEAGVSVANPWIAAVGAGASLVFEDKDAGHIRDLLSAGSPVVLVLASGAISIANGVDANGAITVTEGPIDLNASPVVAAFPQGGVGLANAFTVESPASAGAVVSSPSGGCPSVDVEGVRFHLCDGSQSTYEADFTLRKGAAVVNLASNSVQTIAPGAGLSFAIGHTITPQSLSIGAVVDSAAFGKLISPGGLITIFGTGLATGTTAVSIGGKPAKVLAAFPFQINAQVPTDATTGSLQVTDLLGSVSQPVTISPAAPGIFVLGQLGAILNQDATLNTPDNPALRGQFISIYCSGLGTGAGTEVLLNGVTLKPSYAGLVAGFSGLYQVNVQIPAASAPGLGGVLQLRVGGAVSNTTPVATQ